MLECGRCGTLFTLTKSIGAEIRALYDHYYDRASFSTPPTAEASLERFVRSAEFFRKTGRWLDFGYGEGGLLAVAERHGWTCYGIEVSAPVLEYGRERGWVVTSNPTHDPRFAEGAFDVITMIEFLEHVPAPIRFLRDAARWLRPGGLLYITTPNARSLNRRILGVTWSVVSPPEHVTLWTARALRVALATVGFQICRLRAEGYNPSELLARLRRTRTGEAPVDRNRSALALSAALSRTRVRRALKAAINEGLSALRLGDTLKVWALRVG